MKKILNTAFLFFSVITLTNSYAQQRTIAKSPTRITSSFSSPVTYFAEMGHPSGAVAGPVSLQNKIAKKNQKTGGVKPKQAPVAAKNQERGAVKGPTGTFSSHNATAMIDSGHGGSLCDGTGLCGASTLMNESLIAVTFTYIPGTPSKISLRFSLAQLVARQPTRAQCFYVGNSGALIPNGNYIFVSAFDFSDPMFTNPPLSLPPGSYIADGAVGTYTINGDIVVITVNLML